MNDIDSIPEVAADANIIRLSTPRRYLTALEDLRGRRIVVVPRVNYELGEQLADNAASYLMRRCAQQGIHDRQEVDTIVALGSEGVENWWEQEEQRNDSMYLHINRQVGDTNDVLKKKYRDHSGRLPSAAFNDPGDRRIYAQAWTHKLSAIITRNRESIDNEELELFFAEREGTAPPVALRGLYQHTLEIAQSENRTVIDVASEAMLGAVLPNDWEPSKAAQVLSSCRKFIENLTMSVGRGRNFDVTHENQLILRLTNFISQAENGKYFVDQCEEKFTKLPTLARETEARYHEEMRTPINDRGYDLWPTPQA